MEKQFPLGIWVGIHNCNTAGKVTGYIMNATSRQISKRLAHKICSGLRKSIL